MKKRKQKDENLKGVMIKQFYKENRALSICSIGAMCIIFSYYITYDMPELIQGINKWYELIVTLCVGIITNLIFYIFQVYIPKKKDEKKAFEVMQGRLQELCVLLWETFLLADYFMDDPSKGKLQIKKSIVYYKFAQKKEQTAGWGRRFDLELDFSIMIEKIKKLEEKIISDREFAKCPEELIVIVGNIERNRFFSAIKNAQDNKYINGVTYGDCITYYAPLKEQLCKLKEWVKPEEYYTIYELSSKEIEFYNENVAANLPKDYKVMQYVKMYFE